MNAVYWSSHDRHWGGVLLGIAIALEIGTVGGALLVADAERRLLESLEGRDPSTFGGAVGIFFVATLAYVFASTYRIYTRQAVEIRWRRSLTSHYVERWISARCYLAEELHAGAVDNPQQRIQEDVREFVSSALGLSLSLVAALATLLFFGRFLYNLSASWPIPIAGTVFVPGLMLWVALGTAPVSTRAAAAGARTNPAAEAGLAVPGQSDVGAGRSDRAAGLRAPARAASFGDDRHRRPPAVGSRVSGDAGRSPLSKGASS
jgi:putative ATP-binding cassette transporter